MTTRSTLAAPAPTQRSTFDYILRSALRAVAVVTFSFCVEACCHPAAAEVARSGAGAYVHMPPGAESYGGMVLSSAWDGQGLPRPLPVPAEACPHEKLAIEQVIGSAAATCPQVRKSDAPPSGNGDLPVDGESVVQACYVRDEILIVIEYLRAFPRVSGCYDGTQVVGIAVFGLKR